jgi:hypothetical protein
MSFHKFKEKKPKMRSKLKPFELKEIAPLSTVYVTSVNKRKLEMEEINLKKRKLSFWRRLEL